MSLDKIFSKLTPEQIEKLRGAQEHVNQTLSELFPAVRQARLDLATGVETKLEARSIILALPPSYWELLEVTNSSFNSTVREVVNAETAEGITTPVEANKVFRAATGDDAAALASQFLFDDLYVLAAESVHRYMVAKVQSALMSSDFDKLQTAIDNLRAVDPSLPELNIQEMLSDIEQFEEIEEDDESILPN